MYIKHKKVVEKYDGWASKYAQLRTAYLDK